MSAGIALLVGGIAWWAGFDVLRHRPRNLERGTQHLALAGLPGLVVAAAGLLRVAAALLR